MPTTPTSTIRRATPLLLAAALCTPESSSAQGPVYELDTLHVNAASRLEGGALGRSVTILDRATLLTLPIGGVTEALSYTLGADLQRRSPAQADLSLRGASFEGVVVLVDGVRVSDPQTGHFDLDLAVPLESVERIEILLGPASAQFGPDAVGGVVNVVTGGGRDGAQARVEAGTFDRRMGSISARTTLGTWSGGVAGELARSDGHREGTDYDVAILSGSGAGPLGPGRLMWSAAHARRDFGAAQFYGPFPTSYERTRTTTASLGWVGTRRRLSLEPRGFFRRHTDEFTLRREDPAFYQNYHTSDQWGGSVEARAELGRRGRAGAGAEWVRESLQSNNLGARREDRFGAFGEVVAPIRAATVTLGARTDHYQGFHAGVSPSASVTLPVFTSLRIRAAAGRAFRAPTWTERYYEDPANVANPDLDAERSWTVEAGLEMRLRSGMFLGGTVFRRRSRDLIDWAKPADQPDEPWRTRNVEKATFEGLELTGSAQVFGGLFLAPRASWLRVDAEEAIGQISKAALQPLVRTVGMTVGAKASGGVAVVTDIRQERRRGFDSEFLIDARASLTAGRTEFYVTGRNLTDTSYLDLTGFPAEGLSLTAGMRSEVGNE